MVSLPKNSDSCISTVFLLPLPYYTFPLSVRAAYGKRERYLNVFYTWNTHLMGMYDICQNVQKENEYAPMETRYCREMIIAFGATYSRAICVPASCSNEDLFLVNNAIYARLGVQNLTAVYTCIRDIPWEWDAIFVTCLLSFFALVVVMGTFYDVVFRRRRITAKVKASPVQTEETPKQNGVEEGNENFGLHLEEVKKIDEVSFSTDESTSSQSYASSFMTAEEEEEDEKKMTLEEKVVKTSLIPGCKGKLSELLTSCSLVYNSNKILSAKKNSSSLSSLNGIRVLSMLWIVWGHSTLPMSYSVTDNMKYFYEDMYTGYLLNATFFATFAVDSFFTLSGLLVTYLTLKELKQKNGKLNWFLFYFHRFWRLTPSYMIALGISASLMIHMGVGPTKEQQILYTKQFCTDYWWTNLLYFNNLYPFYGFLGGCMNWSWYLANDMQFYIISPLFIVLLFNRKRLGIASVVAMCISSCAVTAALTAYFGVPVGKSQVYYNNRTDSLEPWGSSSDIIYGKPYCRIQAYMVGMFVGYLIYRHVHIKNIKMHWIVNVIGWIIGLGLMYAMVFALHNTSDQNPLPMWFSALWGGVSRTLFSIGVAWVAFACTTGHGGLINSFLSWSFWTPMARLTYCAYLLHPIVIALYSYTKQIPFHWTVIENTYMFLANAVMSYFAAFCLSLLVEGPTMGLEKVILGKKR
ncbi:Nose resistant to fluoxetine protein 6 [Holothuria leucospilota]|uniref:Nose resistant to fluoxetine protein 6 n=1 Tax=Holothuria leucospilota TaxID=206669 RepID=A0A9Q0YFC6_HOLLE|nr:Nose resistant to fluoxetine protein 6 [Holothuria leucospilota]